MKKSALALFLTATLMAGAHSALANPRVVFVNPAWASADIGSDPDGYGPVEAFGRDGFSNIQDAVNAVEAGGEVWLGEASYNGQVLIEKPLTLNGMGPSSILNFQASSPRVELNTGLVNVPVILVQNTSGVTIHDISIRGNGLGNENNRFMGIAFYNASGKIDEVRVQGIQSTPVDGTQQGIAVYVRNNSETDQQVRISRSSINRYQKGGIVVVGANLTADIFENTIEGIGGTQALAQNGIQVGFGARGNIHNNRVVANTCLSPACSGDSALAQNDNASGILLYYAASGTEVSRNEIENNQCGICSVGTSDLSIQNNEIVNGLSVAVNILEADTYSSYFGYSESSSNVTLSNNNIIGHSYGVIVQDFIAGGAQPQVQAHHNHIEAQSVCPMWTNMSIEDGFRQIDAQENVWEEGESPLTGIYSASCMSGLLAIHL